MTLLGRCGGLATAPQTPNRQEAIVAQATRHWDIAQVLADEFRLNSTDPYLGNEVRVEAFTGTEVPSRGVIVSPTSQRELMGTNERDDWMYSCTITRIAHALGNEDAEERAAFLTEVRLLFHRKRLQCDDGCYLYSSVEPSQVAIPQAWQKSNNSIAMATVNTIVRESREIE